MISINGKYEFCCDDCGLITNANTKDSLFKRFVIYEDITNGYQAHFCDETCAKKYIKDKHKSLSFRRIKNKKDIDISANSVDSNY